MIGKLQTSTPFPGLHNHAVCIRDALEKAENICRSRKVRLTPIRRRVLELVWKSHKPMLAYQLLSTLQADKPNATPTTVYRALEFLLQQKLVHRLETLNAYLGCHTPDAVHRAQFLICSHCGSAAEIEAPSALHELEEQAGILHFTITSPTVELLGFCAGCRHKNGH